MEDIFEELAKKEEKHLKRLQDQVERSKEVLAFYKKQIRESNEELPFPK